MQREKFKILLYLKKSGLDKLGQAPIMGRITYGRTIANSVVSFHVPPICGTLVRAD